MLNECNGCEYKCSMSNIDICTLESPCPNQRSTPMTNFENITKSEESLAEWLGDWHTFSCVFCKHWRNGCVYNHNQVRCAIEEGKSNKELWLEWLKQPLQSVKNCNE